ncbi:MAG: transcriptional regulator, TetR family [Acidobacteria bacterium]|nr:transcriptional regulator, TetR family [Acidobacteriota bacterium]
MVQAPEGDPRLQGVVVDACAPKHERPEGGRDTIFFDHVRKSGGPHQRRQLLFEIVDEGARAKQALKPTRSHHRAHPRSRLGRDHGAGVCQRADVGRSTFYVHFADKEELLVSGFGELRKQLRESTVAVDRKPLAFTRALLEHTREYEPVYRALLGRRTAQVVYRSWIDLVTELLDEDVARLVPASPLRIAAVRYLAGALWELLSWWSEQPKRSSAVDLEETFRRLTMAIVREIQK